MATPETQEQVIHAYLLLMMSQNIFTPYENIEEACQQFNVDLNTLLALYTTRYLNGRDHQVPKSGQMHLAWECASNPADHDCFSHILHVSGRGRHRLTPWKPSCFH